MATLLDFRRRIRSIKNTQQITRAMKFVAAARLRRAQERVIAARPYATQILKVLRSAMARGEQELTHPLLKVRPEKRLLVVVVSADRGLCGAFNTNVLRKVSEFLKANQGKEVQFVAVGKRGRDSLRRLGFRIVAELFNVSMNVQFSHAKEIAELAIQKYTAEEVDAVYLIYNEFKNVIVQNLMVMRLLPVEPEAVSPPSAPSEHPAPPAAGVDYIYEQPPADIFNHLLPRYVESQVFRVLLESAAAEHAARMTAMDAATNNAKDLIESLTLHMNKVRQAAITKEIIEVVSGAASAGA
jgi:F-type H+-transporting ATPase subunit gamma